MVTKINVILLEITEQRSSYIRKVMEDCNISKITHGTLPSSSGAMGAHVPLVGSAYYLLFLQWKGYFGTILKQHIPQRFKCRSKSIWPKYLQYIQIPAFVTKEFGIHSNLLVSDKSSAALDVLCRGTPLPLQTNVLRQLNSIIGCPTNQSY